LLRVRVVDEKPPLSIGMCAQLACILDVASGKPGNVDFAHRHHDMSAVDFLLSAAAIAPVLEQAPFQPIGRTILDSIRATRRVTNANTNLGILLLLAPLASVPASIDLKSGLIQALKRLSVDDSRMAYEAIRLAQPGGLGKVEQQDVSHEPTVSLREAMALAANRDMIALQYTNDFAQVFEAAEILREELARTEFGLRYTIRNTYLRLLAKYPDSLVARKSGPVAADRVSLLAKRAIESRDNHERINALSKLRNLSPAENPGTTADFVTASLFVGLRSGMIEMPFAKPFHLEGFNAP
jgi:triphosphoribosyl-dephospho-CoA synthase